MFRESDDGFVAAPTLRTTTEECPRLCRTHPTLALLLISAAGLFLELLLIRWIGTEVRIFAYLQNTVLVVCFLGLGMGCFSCRQPVRMRDCLLPLTLLAALFAVPPVREALASISMMLAVLGDFVIWGQYLSESPFQTVSMVVVGLALTLGLMYLVWWMSLPFGRILGRLLDDHPSAIVAYSVNVAGSLFGTWLFVLCSAWYAPPVVWAVVLAPLLLPFMLDGPAKKKLGAVLSLTLLAGLMLWASAPGTAVRAYWSPYQKLVMHTLAKTAPFTDGEYMINVNNTGYQALLNLDPAHVAAHPEAYPQEQNGFSQYDIPLLLHPAPDAVLIVGAGAGNDAAGALRQGARRVVAVEIDPAIIAMGKAHHPEHPYDSPRVTVVNNDARSFFATCAERFDVIAFGLLDSHTTTAMTNARLDHYVYTRESLEHVRSLLRPGGIVFLSFEPEKPYIADRMGRALGEVFGARPLVFRIPSNRMGFGGAAFVAGDVAMAEQRIAGNPALAGLIQRWTQEAPLSLSYTTPIATDDWPYIYLDKPRIPALFGLLAVLLVLLLLLGQRHSGVRLLASAKWGRPQWHFFFLGAAFLLLEVQNVSKAAVVLGNTWSVNAVIISGVLGMILVANLLAAKWPAIPMKPVYALLVGSCLALYFVDLSSLAFLPYFAKAAAVSVLTTLPMLFSGIVFIHAYAGTANKDLAIGANLLGALVGGVLQSVTFLTGIRALLLIVAALYLLAILTRVRGPQVLNAREVPGGLALDPRSA